MVLKIMDNKIEDIGLSIDITQHMNRAEIPICVATSFSLGFLVILYEGKSEEPGFVNQVFVLVRNLFNTPEIRPIDPQRLCNTSSSL